MTARDGGPVWVALRREPPAGGGDAASGPNIASRPAPPTRGTRRKLPEGLRDPAGLRSPRGLRGSKTSGDEGARGGAHLLPRQPSTRRGTFLPQGRAHRRDTRCTPNMASSTPRRARSQRAHPGRWRASSRCHNGVRLSRGRRHGDIAPFARRRGSSYTPGASAPPRRADDELPPAALDADDAGRVSWGSKADAAPSTPMPPPPAATASTPTGDARSSSARRNDHLPPARHRPATAPGVPLTHHRTATVETPPSMPVGHAGHREGDADARRRPPPAPRWSSATTYHLMLRPGAETASPRWGASTLPSLGGILNRFARLPGHGPVGASGSTRTASRSGGHVDGSSTGLTP